MNIALDLFDRLARADGRPTRARVRELQLEGANGELIDVAEGHDEAEAVSLADRCRPLLEPVPFSKWIDSGSAGVPFFTAEEVHDFVAELPTSSEPGSGQRWFEFTPLVDDTFVLTPNDADGRPRLEVLLPIPINASSTRLACLEQPVTPGDTRPVTLVAKPCELNSLRQLENMPYRGACERVQCTGGCQPLVKYLSDTNSYRLDGCEC